MDAAEEQTKNQFVQVIQHYGMETTVALFAMALLETSESLKAIGADPVVVQQHQSLGSILAAHVA